MICTMYTWGKTKKTYSGRTARAKRQGTRWKGEELTALKQVNSPFTVTITDEFVQIEHTKRRTEKVRWDDLIEIWMIDTDAGPAVPDIWMALVGANGGCLIPTSDCNGYEQVYDIVSKYEGFNFQNVIRSMSTAHNERFLLWRKK